MNIKAPKNINKKAQFLAGIGASAWFYISERIITCILPNMYIT